MKIALHLARNHVPAFRMKNPGKKREWTDLKLKLLVLHVRIRMKEKRLSRAEAIKDLSANGNVYQFDGGREGLRNRVIEGEKLFNIKILEKYGLEDLREVEKYQLDINRRVEEALKQWRD